MADKLEWEIKVPLVTNPYVLTDVLVVLFISSAAVAGLVLLVSGFEAIYEVGRVFLLTSSIVVVLALLVMGFVFMNKMDITFRIDSHGIHSQMGAFPRRLNRVAWVIGILAQNLTVTGASMMAASREKLTIPWGDIEKVAFDDRRRVITVSKGRRVLQRVFCSEDNYSESVELMYRYAPDAVPGDSES